MLIALAGIAIAVFLAKYAQGEIGKEEIVQEVVKKTNDPTALIYLEQVLSDRKILQELREAA